MPTDPNQTTLFPIEPIEEKQPGENYSETRFSLNVASDDGAIAVEELLDPESEEAKVLCRPSFDTSHDLSELRVFGLQCVTD